MPLSKQPFIHARSWQVNHVHPPREYVGSYEVCASYERSTIRERCEIAAPDPPSPAEYPLTLDAHQMEEGEDREKSSSLTTFWSESTLSSR